MISDSTHVMGSSITCPTAVGSGLRLREAMQLRIKDLDFPQHQIVVRDTKGQESRLTMLPTKLIYPLQEHLHDVKRLHQRDLDQGYGSETSRLPHISP